MLVIRPTREGDLDALETFALTAYTGITSLPKDRDLLRKKIAASKEAFSREVVHPRDEAYYFILEDEDNETFAGTSGIYGRSGWNQPLYFYRIETEMRQSDDRGRMRELKLLRPVHYQPGPTELVSLYLMPDYRKGGLGRLLSLSRLLFMACHPQRFTKTVMAQMRGVIEKNYYSPFWQHIGRCFLHIDFAEAMRRLSLEGKDFIPECLPEHPIYVDLLDPEAQRVIGKAHPNTRPALAFLEKEGFSFANEVDVFDAGPKILAERDEIRTIRELQRVEVGEVVDREVDSQRFLISNMGLKNFRACFGHIQINPDSGKAILSRDVAEALRIDSGNTIQYVSPFPKLIEQGANHDHDSASLHPR